MDLPNLFKSGASQAKSEHLITVVLTDSSVQGLLLKISPAGSRIVSQSRVLSYSDAASLVMKADEALQELGPESENVTKVIFALDHSWMESGQVTGEYSEYVARITTELSLQPVGFVVQSEAVLQHKFDENPHYSGILCIITRESISVSVMSKGTPLGTELVGRSDSLAADIVEGLARFHQSSADDTLPDTLILSSVVLAEEELATAQQDTLNQEWGSFEFFTGVPHVEILQPNALLQLIAVQAGSAWLHLSSQAHSATVPVPVATNIPEIDEPSDEASPEKTPEQLQDTPLDSLPEEHNNVQSSAFGIPLEKEETAVPETAVPSVTTSEKIPEVLPEPPLEKVPQKSPGAKKKIKPTKKNIIIFSAMGFVAGLLVLAVGSFLWMLLGSTVTVAVTPERKAISSNIQITLTAEGETNPEEKVLKAEIVEAQASGTRTTDASGVKIVGEKASGTVKIYNKTEADKIFPAGVVVGTDDDIEFTTNEEITVPAAEVKSSTSGEEKKYGSAEVAATAVVIGSESNIEKGRSLSVADFGSDTYSAETVDDFTGGSSREVRVVSKTDQDVLASELKKELTKQAEDQLKTSGTNGQFFAPNVTVVVDSAEYDREIEDEADQVTLTMSVTVSTLVYKAEDIKPIVEYVLQEEVPEGYEFTEKDPQLLSAPLEDVPEGEDPVLDVNVSTFAVAVVPVDEVKQSVLGKPINQALDTAKGNTAVSQASVVFAPSFAKNIVKSIPDNENRVTIVINEYEE